MPVIAIATVAATSSELNGSSVITNTSIPRKEGFSSPVMRPKLAILDPELTFSVSLQRTAYSAADIISHLMEAYFGHDLDWAPFQDRYCQGSIRTIMDCVDRIIVDPQDKEARSQMMWTASFAWSGFYPCGLGETDATIHILGHSLSNYYDTPHGAAMSVTILGTMKYFIDKKTKKFAEFAREVFQVRETDDKKAALAGLDRMEKWFRKIGAPTTLKEAGIPDNAIAKMAPDALITAQAWGLGDRYSVEKLTDLYNKCV
jgi:alcohol dehydrogenase YqhD (iron-dependent ADH family)